MKLSKAQLNILNLMNSGWELGVTITGIGDYWIQKGGLGRGGEAKHGINSKTIFKLEDLKLIKRNERHFPTTSHSLTDKGKEFLQKLEIK